MNKQTQILRQRALLLMISRQWPFGQDFEDIMYNFDHFLHDNKNITKARLWEYYGKEAMRFGLDNNDQLYDLATIYRVRDTLEYHLHLINHFRSLIDHQHHTDAVNSSILICLQHMPISIDDNFNEKSPIL